MTTRYTVDTVEESKLREEYGNCSFGMPNCLGYAEKWKSGQAICWPCWYDVKLNHPAAVHWSKAAWFFLSNIDTWDIQTYLMACGLTKDEMTTMLKSVEKVFQHSDALVFQDHPVDTLDDEGKQERYTYYKERIKK